MKGIILAAGKGTRLYPITRPVCKPLLPVYDKPLIYYSISTLMMAGIRDILIIIPPGQESAFRELLGDGESFGIDISYAVQHVPRGIADAFIVGEDFIGGGNVCLMLGDNIFWHQELEKTLREAAGISSEPEQSGGSGNIAVEAHNTGTADSGITGGAAIFGIKVDDPRPFGVVEFDENGKAVSIEEKPENPKSQYIIPGLYFYDNDVVEIAKGLKPSARGELEITDVNLEYLRRGNLRVIPLADDIVWLDAGTVTTLHESACRIYEIQQTGEYVAYPEKIALDNGYIDRERFIRQAEDMENTEYGQRLKLLI